MGEQSVEKRLLSQPGGQVRLPLSWFIEAAQELGHVKLGREKGKTVTPNLELLVSILGIEEIKQIIMISLL